MEPQEKFHASVPNSDISIPRRVEHMSATPEEKIRSLKLSLEENAQQIQDLENHLRTLQEKIAAITKEFSSDAAWEEIKMNVISYLEGDIEFTSAHLRAFELHIKLAEQMLEIWLSIAKQTEEKFSNDALKGKVQTRELGPN